MKISFGEQVIVGVGMLLIILYNMLLVKPSYGSFEPYYFDSDRSNLSFQICKRVAFEINVFGEGFVDDITNLENVGRYAQQLNYTLVSDINIMPTVSSEFIHGSFYGCKVMQ